MDAGAKISRPSRLDVFKGPWRAIWACVGLLLSLSPVVRWRGTAIRLPLSWFPLFEVLRYSSRLGVSALIAGGLLAGLGYARLGRTWRVQSRILLAGLLVAGGYVEWRGGIDTPLVGSWRAQTFFVVLTRLPGGVKVPARFLNLGQLPKDYPIRPAPSALPPWVDALLRAQDGPLLVVPISVAPRTSDEKLLDLYRVQDGVGTSELQAEAMVQSIGSWRPLLNGFSGYYPASFPDRMRLVQQLPDLGALETLRAGTGLVTILVGLERLSPEKRDRWEEAAAQGAHGLRLEGRDINYLVFRVQRPHPTEVMSSSGVGF